MAANPLLIIEKPPSKLQTLGGLGQSICDYIIGYRSHFVKDF